jgi:hypothetical protein
MFIPVVIGILSMIVIMGLLLLLTFMLSKIQEIDIDKKTIKQKVRDIIETAMAVIDALFNGITATGDSDESRPWYGKILDFMGGTVKTIAVAIMSIAPLALMMISIGLVQLLARQLKDIQDLELDAGAVKSKIAEIISAANSVIEGVFQKDNKKREQPKSLFSKLLRMALPDSMLDMMDALAAVGKLTLAWVAVGLVKNIAEALNTIMSFNIKGGIHGKINLILNTAHSVVDTVLAKSGGDTKGLSKKISKVEDYLEDICDVMEELGEVVDEFNKIQTIEDTKMKSITNSTNHLISLVNNLVTGVKAGVWSVDKRLDQMGRLYKVIRDFSSLSPSQVKNSEAITKNYISLLDKIGTTDIEKLKTTVNLFEKMAEFSKSINGNFEGLAEALNEKIAPLLEKIQNGMDGLKSSVEQSSADVSSSVYAASQGTLSNEEMKKQVGRENPQASEKDKNDMVMKRMQQQIIKQNNELSSNIDELISLFRNGNARVTIRQ